jgi:hypothetical protein
VYLFFAPALLSVVAITAIALRGHFSRNTNV